MFNKKDFFKVIIGVLIGIVISLAAQKGLKEYKYKQLLKKPAVSIMQISEGQLKRAFKNIIIKDITVGNATEKDMEREKIRVKEIKKGKPPYIVVTYEVPDLTEPAVAYTQIGIPYLVTAEYEVKGVIKKISYIVFYKPDDNTFSSPNEIGLLKKDRDAKILFDKNIR